MEAGERGGPPLESRFHAARSEDEGEKGQLRGRTGAAIGCWASVCSSLGLGAGEGENISGVTIVGIITTTF